MKFILYQIETPYYQFDNPFVQKLYSESLNLKIDGFNSVYDRVIPNDLCDLISDHFVFCIPTINGLEVVSAFKFVRKSQIDPFNKKLPCVDLAKSFINEEYDQRFVNSVEEYIDSFKILNKDVMYCYSLTIAEKYRKTKLAKSIINLTYSAVKLYGEEYNIGGVIIAGMEIVKTDKLLKFMGMEKFKGINGEEYSYMKSPGFNNENAIMMKHKKWSNEYLEMCEENRELFISRIIIKSSSKESIKLAA